MKRLLVLLLIIVIGVFLRVWQLPQLPPGLWYDEAYNALDALWMVQSGEFPPFFVGNNGREPMWHYLVLLSNLLLGNTTFAIRLVGAVAGIITIPIMYRFAYAFLSPFAVRVRHRCWLALVAMGWLAVSWWHLLNSRGGFRPILLPPLLMLSLYFWLLAIKQTDADKGRSSIGRFMLAGLFLGLTQYTYLPARLAPFIFIGFVLLWTLQIIWRHRKTSWPTLQRLWLGLLVTLVVAAVVFIPLGLFYFNNPETFSSRTGDVVFSPDTLHEFSDHLWQAVTLFLGAGHELYRHHLPGRAMLGWLEIPFFFVGLVALLRPSLFKRAETQLILLGFVAMWLPALLASPPVHTLRPIGLLPFYYLLVTLGLYYSARWVANILHNAETAKRLAFFVLPVVIIGVTGLINAYDYFQRWGNHPDTYIEYNGPLVDLIREVVDLTETNDVIIPLHLYVHPTTRYLLWDSFPEVDGPLPPSSRPAEMVLIPDNFQLLYVGNIPASPAMVLLTRNAAGQGYAYVSRPPRADEQPAIIAGLMAVQNQLRPFVDNLGRTVAQFAPLETGLRDMLAPLFDPAPLRLANLNWANQAQLIGYDVTPQVAEPGQGITLNLYWHSLTDETFEHRLFLQLIDDTGNPVNQWEVNAYNEDMYRWRPDGLLPTQHILNLPDNVSPGPYLVRLGFFDPASGDRLPLWVGGQPTDIDQIQLGLFYVSSDGTDPRQPDISLSANFADSIELVGVTATPYSVERKAFALPTPYSTLAITLHWQSLHPTDKPYTVFLQLLNEQGEVVAGWDQQPFDGLYPTNLWSPGETIADTVQLPLPEDGLPPGAYRLITGLYDFDTGQRLPVIGDGDFTQLIEFEVE